MSARSEDLLTYAEPHDPTYKQWTIRIVEKLSGQPKLLELYERVRETTTHAPTPKPHLFFGAALEELGVVSTIEPEDLSRVPPEGPLVFVANHPFGVLDGLGLCDLALRARGDVRVIIHRALFRDTSLQQFMLPIDFEGSRAAAKRNIAVRNEAIDYLVGGGAIAVFPAGGISTADHPFGPATDLEWKLLPAKLIQKAEATVVPVHFSGQNSWLFQLVSMFSQTLRMSLVIREVENKRNEPLRVTIGHPIPFSELAEIRDRKALTAHLRAQVYALDPEARRERTT